MAESRDFAGEREEMPMSDVEAAFEHLIETLDAFNGRLTDEQYKQLQDYLPSNLTVDELGVAVGKLVGANCVKGDFANTLTDAFKEAIQTSPETLQHEHLLKLSTLVHSDESELPITTIDYQRAKGIIIEACRRTGEYNNDKRAPATVLTSMVSEALVKLNTGFTMEQLAHLCEHYDGRETVVPEMVNGRTTGTVEDGDDEVRIKIPMGGPKDPYDLSDAVMNLVDRLGTRQFRVDERAWDHLLIYIPQHRMLKRHLKKIEKVVGLTSLKKTLKKIIN